MCLSELAKSLTVPTIHIIKEYDIIKDAVLKKFYLRGCQLSFLCFTQPLFQGIEAVAWLYMALIQGHRLQFYHFIDSYTELVFFRGWALTL